MFTNNQTMAKAKTKDNRGGANRGQGRKPIDPALKVVNNTSIVAFRVKKEQVEPVKKLVNDYLKSECQ